MVSTSTSIWRRNSRRTSVAVCTSCISASRRLPISGISWPRSSGGIRFVNRKWRMADISGLSRRPVYMDHHATTPVDRRALDVMLPYFTDHFGNAASTDHGYGAEAAQAVEGAREQIARLI